MHVRILFLVSCVDYSLSHTPKIRSRVLLFQLLKNGNCTTGSWLHLGVYLLPACNYGYTSVAFTQAQGALARIQTPEKDTNVRLSSMGLYSSERWRLYGEFGLRPTICWQCRVVTSEMPRNGMPWLFASPRKGNWQNETYLLKGVAGYVFTPVCHCAGLQIRYHKGARSNDPRPSAESF